MEKYLMGIDAGNTSSKVVIFDLYGKMIATAATPSMHFKRRGEGFEEFDVTELWNLISVCIKEAVEKAAVAPEQIAGVGVTSFGNGVVFLDKEGYAIAPGCFSQDYRANSIIEMYQREGTYEKINDIVKGTLFAGEPGPILRWYKENYREIYDQIGGILQFKDYIMYRLTNVFATDLNCFGGAFMVDMNTMDYSRELMDRMEKSAAEKAVNALSLEVRAGNEVALGLYQSYGFREEARRKNYYQQPVEDAVIMWLRNIPVVST